MIEKYEYGLFRKPPKVKEIKVVEVVFHDNTTKKLTLPQGSTFIWEWANWHILVHDGVGVASNVKSFKIIK